MSDTQDEDTAPEDTKTISLPEPVRFKGGTFQHLSLHEPTAGQMRKAEGQMRNNMSNEGVRLYNMHLIAMVSEWPIPAVEMLPVRVFNEAAAYLQSFTDAGQATGSS